MIQTKDVGVVIGGYDEPFRSRQRHLKTDKIVESYAVEATEFPDLARKYRVNGVPKTVVNDQIEILGGIPQDDFIQQALALP